MQERIAIISGLRTPMGKMGGKLAKFSADQLGGIIVKELVARNVDLKEHISEVIIGNVGQPANAANISRVIALRAGLNKGIPAYTVHRNCASGFESITTAACKILAGEGDVILAGGAESMSNIPFFFSSEYKAYMENFARCRTTSAKLKHILKFKLKYLNPQIGLKMGLTDPICGLIMGDTAELIAKEHGITRKMQDEFALESQRRASIAMESGIFAEEIYQLIDNPDKESFMEHDEGIRSGQKIADLEKLRPFFDRVNGTVTAGNSSQITDGAAAVMLCSEKRAKELGIKPLGYLKAFSYAGLDPERMGLGPVYAASKVLEKTKMKIKDFDLFEINEAFAAQVLACLNAFSSKKFASDKLGLSEALGEIDQAKLNVNGGAIALGHPVGMTGTRIAIHALKELKRRKGKRALVSLCIGGGQGGALILEAN